MAETGEHSEGLLLGRQVPVTDRYAPELLYPIPRSAARDVLGIQTGVLPFQGVDLWHAYELSWLDGAGRPEGFVGRFSIPVTSPFLVESKSFKLYLNSLNQQRFASSSAAIAQICSDVGAVAGADVNLDLFAVDDPALAGRPLPGDCLDQLDASWSDREPDISRMQVGPGSARQICYTHLLRSLCPVTGQPDWATLWIDLDGRELVPETLLEYLLSYRNHQEFHEQCVERIFCDIYTVCSPIELCVQAFYTRRGGLDITPFRSIGDRQPLPRMNRQ